MAHKSTIAGVLVGIGQRSYKPFTDGKGDTVPGGVIRTAYVSQGFESEPVAVRVREVSDFDALAAAGFGSDVVMECTLFAKGNRIELTLDLLEVSAGTTKRNGREPIRAAS